jgi:hypothetical protein
MDGYTTLQILSDSNGRFGNQLFRIGTIIAQSKKNNKNFYIPLEWKHCDIFPYLSNKVSFLDIEKNVTFKHIENKFGYHEIPSDSGLIELMGYFQSSKFLEGYEDVIRENLKIDEKIIEQVSNKINQSSKKLSVHIRWGDVYDRERNVGHKGVEQYHPVMSLEYYNKSIEYILNNRQVDEIYVFTDNIDTKEFIFGKFEKFGKPIIYCDYNSDFIYDFTCQYLCNYFVIANSTFSWWSAFLNNYENKLVCCPYENEWFGSSYSHLDTSGLIPLDWIKIKQ